MTGKYLKYLKYLKKEKIKIKGYGTRFARVVSKAKALIMYSLRSYFFKSKNFKVRTLRDALYFPKIRLLGACNQ